MFVLAAAVRLFTNVTNRREDKEMEFFGWIFYLVVGILLAVVYCTLAGWGPVDNFVMVAFTAPAFLFVWIILAIMAGVLTVNGRRRLRFNWRVAVGKEREAFQGSRVIFWVWTLYCLAPIIVHWSAQLLMVVGFDEFGAQLDVIRYSSTLVLITSSITLLILIVLVSSAWEAVEDQLRRFWPR